MAIAWRYGRQLRSLRSEDLLKRKKKCAWTLVALTVIILLTIEVLAVPILGRHLPSPWHLAIGATALIALPLSLKFNGQKNRAMHKYFVYTYLVSSLITAIWGMILAHRL